MNKWICLAEVTQLTDENVTLSAIKCSLSYFCSVFLAGASSILCGNISAPYENKVSGLGGCSTM